MAKSPSTSRRVYTEEGKIEKVLYDLGIPDKYLQELVTKLTDKPLAHINFALEAFARLTPSRHLSLDDAIDFLPVLVEAASEYRSSLAKQDDVLAQLTQDYLIRKRGIDQEDDDSEGNKIKKGRHGKENGRHSWRKHEAEARRDRRKNAPEAVRILPLGKDRLLLRIDDAVKTDRPRHYGDERERKAHRLEHTNQILEYLGIPDGVDRSKFLKQFGGTHHSGADIVRATYSMGADLGLFGAVGSATAEQKRIFESLGNYIGRFGEQRALALIQLVGPANFPKFADYVVARVGNQVSLLGGRGNTTIADELEGMVKKWEGPNVLTQRGYSRKEVEGFVTYTR